MKINPEMMEWTREPKQFAVTENRVEIITEPHTDLWQRTYYHFRNDNAPALQMKTREKYFSSYNKVVGNRRPGNQSGSAPPSLLKL